MSTIDDFLKLAQLRENRSARAQVLDAYYDGTQRVRQLGLSLPPQMQALETVVNWPRLVVDSIAERMDIEGFRVAGDAELGELCFDWWLANDMDAIAPLGWVEALVQGHAFIVTNVPQSGLPKFSVESGATMSAKWDRLTGQVASAAMMYEPDENGRPTKGAYYLADTTTYLAYASGGWKVDTIVRHNLGEVPVKVIRNRARIGDLQGRSEIADIIPITDAAARLMTNLQAAQEFLALPQRYVLGASESDFKDKDGNVVPKWQAYIGNFLALGNEKASMGQLAGADLRNFVEVFQMYARQVASLSKLPPHRLGLTGTQAVSADAIRSDESDLVKRIYDRMRSFETAWEASMRLALRWAGRTLDPSHRIEAIWASPETPTFAAKVDAVQKMVGGPIIARTSGVKELFPPEKAKEYEADWQRQTDPIESLTRAVFQEPASE